MKHLTLLFIVTGVASLLISCTSVSVPQHRTLMPEQLSIRVTSNDPNEEISFDGAYLFQLTGSEFKTVDRKTPFEIGMTSKFVSGIFHKKSGKGDLKVELLKQIGEEKESVVSGWGDVIVLGTTDDSKHNFFVQTF